MEIAVIGTGYVGLVSGVCFAEIGHHVTCVDNNEAKIDKLLRGEIPIYEPGLDALVERNRKAGRLEFTTRIADGVRRAEVIFVAVGTPPKASGEADLSYIEQVAREVAQAMDSYRVIVEKSTVPVKTAEWVERTIRFNNKARVEFDVASNPEFLREGSAIEDFMNPDRIVVGVRSQRAAKLMREIYEPIIQRRHVYDVVSGQVIAREPQSGDIPAPLIVTDVSSAELIKHASNSFLALKISYVNAVANFCELAGANIDEVSQGMGLDSRIGRQFLNAGIGFGGSCFPKDVVAFYEIARDFGYDMKLLRDVLDINAEQRNVFIRKIKKALWIVKGKTIGILGLSFKPNTDDMREAPAIDIIQAMLAEGAKVKVYDPEAMAVARDLLPPEVVYCKGPYEVAEGADALVLVTEWDEFRRLDMTRVKELLNYPILIDGRNIWEPERMKTLGFDYDSVGRPERSK